MGMKNSESSNARLRELFRSADWLEPELLVLAVGDKPVPVAKCFLGLKRWTGEPIASELQKQYGKKAVVDCNGGAGFAELAILDLLQSAQFEGIWVDSWRKKFWKSPWVVEALPLLTQTYYDKIVEAHGSRGDAGTCWHGRMASTSLLSPNEKVRTG
jgi:hypothetical protein